MNDRVRDILGKLPDMQAVNAKIQADWREKQVVRERGTRANALARFRKNNPTAAALISERSRVKRDAQIDVSGSPDEARFKMRQIKAVDAPCHYCGCPLMAKNIVIDHVIPLSRGGMHIASNLVGCCHHCNSSKGNKTNWKPKPSDMWRPAVLEVED